MDKWLQQLHFVIRAKAYLTGELAMRAFKVKRVHYVIIATDISIHHREAIIERLTYYQIPYRIILTKDDLAKLTQKKQVVMLAITNAQLALALRQKETTYEENQSSSSGKHSG